MTIIGKILLFNDNDGSGTIISMEKEEISFSVDDWNDFDLTPSVGLEVEFTYKNFKSSSIISIITKDKEHFTQEKEITTLDDIENEFGQQKEDVKLTLNISKSILNYFDIINENIRQRASYKKVPGRLDYLLVRRFIWTTYNNLSEIDLEVLTPDIKVLSKDLTNMSSIYDDFSSKTRFPALAYEEVFLSCQADFINVREDTQKIIEKLSQLRMSEEHIGKLLKLQKKELNEKVGTKEHIALKKEFKTINGAYVDTIHMIGELDARYKHDIELVHNFEKKFKSEFYSLFADEAKKYKLNIIDILSAQAFLLDAKLWKKAQASTIIKNHFKKAGVTADLNTKTYLRYYLDTLDSDKTGDETQKLFELFDYLTELHKENIMVLVSSAQDAMEYEADIKRIDKTYNVKAFIDEKTALQWAMKNSIKALVVEDQLAKLQLATFFKHYKKLIPSVPKIILLGRDSKSNIFPISKTLAKGVSPRVISKNIKELVS